MNKLIVGNLLHRPLRSLLSLSAIAIEVIMILSITALMLGQLDDSKARTNGIGADMVVRPANASFLAGFGGAPVPAKIADVLAKLPHVVVAAPVIVQLTLGSSVENIYGIDFKSFNALRPFVFIAGTPFQGPNDVIVDDIYAASDHGHHVGETIDILKHPFRICGIVQHGKGGRKFVPITTLGALTGSPNNASIFYLRTEGPKFEAAIAQEILATPGLGQYQVQTTEEMLSQLTPSKIPALTASLNVVIGIAMIVGFLAIFQSMYTAVMERTREIGILKSLGASRSYIVSMVLRETGLLALGGVGAGVALSYVVRTVVMHRFPTVPFPLTTHWILWGMLLAFVGAIVGALYPAYKAAQKDPIDALAYE
ncbi:MAG TPA: FtsX-like permease family protein [Acidobacteriaceae bacterium]|nr:FtsX-like permease family protein [Acidobacteriaceae bacterium]